MYFSQFKHARIALIIDLIIAIISQQLKEQKNLYCCYRHHYEHHYYYYYSVISLAFRYLMSVIFINII